MINKDDKNSLLDGLITLYVRIDVVLDLVKSIRAVRI